MGETMKQRYAFITFFLTLIIYHFTHSCSTCLNQETTNLGPVYLAVQRQMQKQNGLENVGIFDPAFTGA